MSRNEEEKNYNVPDKVSRDEIKINGFALEQPAGESWVERQTRVANKSVATRGEKCFSLLSPSG
jgi:hypothetical protein